MITCNVACTVFIRDIRQEKASTRQALFRARPVFQADAPDSFEPKFQPRIHEPSPDFSNCASQDAQQQANKEDKLGYHMLMFQALFTVFPFSPFFAYRSPECHRVSELLALCKI